VSFAWELKFVYSPKGTALWGVGMGSFYIVQCYFIFQSSPVMVARI